MKYIMYLGVLMCCCFGYGQDKWIINTEDMKRFDIKKFEENKGKGKKYYDSNGYDYMNEDGYLIVQHDSGLSKDDLKTRYIQKIIKEFSPFRYSTTYYNNGVLARELYMFNSSPVTLKDYNAKGDLIKEKNYDEDFKYSFEQIRDFVLKEKGVDIYDTRQVMAFRYNTPASRLKKYYQIHVLKSEYHDGKWDSYPDYSFLIDDETGKIDDYKQPEVSILEEEKKADKGSRGWGLF